MTIQSHKYFLKKKKVTKAVQDLVENKAYIISSPLTKKGRDKHAFR